jgi:predicted Holliday junction resolvase-like endonuclease
MLSSPQIIFVLALLLVLSLLAVILIAAAWRRERKEGQARIESLLSDQQQVLVDARRESVDRSRSTLKGQIAEQLAPLLPGFRYLPADARFLGDPIDYVVFSGYTGVRDSRASPESLEVVLLEVKQGGSALSGFQRAIARSVEEGRVRFEVLRISDDGTTTTEAWRPRTARGGRGSPPVSEG